jgi:glutathione synthase/RimK-type ligase-like ATP-grasp enzyme
VSRLGIFVDRRTLSSAEQLHALIRCRDAAESLGHSAEFLFPVDITKIPRMDAVFIRARTDPLNVTYIASRMAESCGIPVIDDPASIRICSDKVNMYSHLMRRDIAIPETLFLSRDEVSLSRAEEIFARLGCPLVLKEPSTSFSLRVEKVTDPEQFMRVASRFFRLSDWIVVQEFVESRYDWRVGVLDGQLLYVCKYTIPEATFKIQDSVNGHLVYCRVESIPEEDAPKPVVDMGIAAGRAIGGGLYGVDLKTTNGDCRVIEVNDNPSLDGGEDAAYPGLYARIIDHLLGK